MAISQLLQQTILPDGAAGGSHQTQDTLFDRRMLRWLRIVVPERELSSYRTNGVVLISLSSR